MQGTTLYWEKPSTNTRVTHTVRPTEIPAGTRIGLTGHRDTAPDPHAMALRVDWAGAPSAGRLPGEPLLSSTAWEVARVSEAFAATFSDDPPPPGAWAPAVNVGPSVGDGAKHTAPAGAAHVAAVSPAWEDPNVKYWVAFRSPPTPSWAACTVAAAPADSGPALSTAAAASVGVVVVALVGAVIGGGVRALRAPQRRRARNARQPDAGGAPKPDGGSGDGDADEGARGGRQADAAATPAAGTSAAPPWGGLAATGSPAPPSEHFSVATICSPAVTWAAAKDMRAQAVAPPAGDPPAAPPRRGDGAAGGGGGPPSDIFSVATTDSPAETWATGRDATGRGVAARALGADVAAAARVLYETTVASDERGGGGAGGAPMPAGGAAGMSSCGGGGGGRGSDGGSGGGGGSGSGGGGGGGGPPGAVAMRESGQTGTALPSGGTGTLSRASLLVGSLVCAAERPAAPPPLRVKRGVALPDEQ